MKKLKKPWRIRISLAVLFTISLHVILSSAHTSQAAPMKLTVMSYNIFEGIGSNGKYDLTQIASQLRQQKPTLVGLQEVAVHWSSKTHYDNQAALLAKQLHMYYFFAPMYVFPAEKPNQPPRQWGVALLSQFPIVETVNHPLTRISTKEPNPIPSLYPGFAESTIQLPDGQIQVFVTHLDYRKQSSIRRTQVEETINYLGERRQRMLLLGDLNASPNSPELVPLFHVFRNTMEKCTGSCRTFPAAEPKVLIDYVLATPDFHVSSAEVLPFSTSDHRPVKAELFLKPSGTHTDASNKVRNTSSVSLTVPTGAIASKLK